jgi:DNA polymerase III epsilon subunit-like protein
MYFTEFSTWFQTRAIQQLKQSIDEFNQIMDEQFQNYKKECKPSTDQIPPEYLDYQVERCLSAFKTNLLSELQQTCFQKKFTIGPKTLTDKPIKLSNKTSLMERAKLSASAYILQALPQLAFLDIETDGTNIDTANILQVAIIKPIVDLEHDTLNYITSWSSYISPYKGYSQKDNKAYHINHIGDEQLKAAIKIEEAVFHIIHHLEDTVIVGYNINQFDIPIIKRECEKHYGPIHYKYSIDLYPAIWKDKKQKLEDAIKAYNLPVNSNPHDATADASCCMDLLYEAIERNELPNTEEEQLDLFSSPQNIWQHYKRLKVIDINPKNRNYSHLLYLTPTSSLKRKLSEISTT